MLKNAAWVNPNQVQNKHFFVEKIGFVKKN